MLMSTLVLFIAFMFYFVNTFYYVAVLLSSMVFILVYLVYLNSFSTVFSIMLALIYIGAMMIFIGYVCAISPNPLFVSGFSIAGLLFLSFSAFFVFPSVFPFFSSNHSYFLSDFFYSSDGSVVFMLIVFLLFFILLVVSSQYFLPKGPFRSV